MNGKIFSLIALLSAVLILPADGAALPQDAQTLRSGVSPTDKVTPAGMYRVHVLTGDTWREAGSIACDKFFRERRIDLGRFVAGSGPAKIRLVQQGGGAAHIDAIFLGDMPPAEVKGVADPPALKKLARKDFDVIDAYGKTIDLLFPAGGADRTLTLTARVEGERISETPFHFPVSNLYHEMTPAAAFYPYWLSPAKAASVAGGKVKGSSQPFFKEWSVTGSGHPSGFTYGWVTNDDRNLYVKIDFTPDDTVDGDKDYTKVYVKTKSGLKEFKLTASEKRWGSADFTYTDKVAYQHKVYDFTIPLKELGIKDVRKSKDLQLAFAAYGTAAPGGIQFVAESDGTGSGVLTSATSGVSCRGNICKGILPPGTNVVITAIPATSSAFGGWSGCDSVSGNDCSLTLNLDTTVTATYNAATPSGNEWRNLGTFGGWFSFAYGISADGGTAVGKADTTSGTHAFRWTRSGGMADLGTFGGWESTAYGVSADGSVVVGEFRTDVEPHAFRWTQAGGMVDLGFLPSGHSSEAHGVSADGSVVVGNADVYISFSYGWNPHAFRWTPAGGMVDFGTFGGLASYAWGVSADGSVVVGESQYSNGDIHAFRWTETGEMVDLGTLTGGTNSYALGVSADGSVVVGRAFGNNGNEYEHAFRWTQADGMVDLGTLPGGVYSRAYGVSADGSVVIGEADDAAGKASSFRWTEATGMQSIAQWLAGNGVDATSVSFTAARGLSADGTAIVGQVMNGNAFLARTGVVIPAVTTAAVSAVTSASATGGGNVIFDGGGVLTARGICWSTSAAPSLGGSCTSDDGGTSAFTSAITGLTPATAYHVRAYATNSAGTGYGSDSSFTTLAKYDLSAAVAGSGSGTLSSATPGVTCSGTSCSGTMDSGTSAVISATPATGFSADWTGCDSVSGNNCTVTMSAAKNVTATFTVKSYTVNFYAMGQGTISGNASQAVPYGGSTTAVTAVPDPGYCLSFWSTYPKYAELIIFSRDNPLTVTNVNWNYGLYAFFITDRPRIINTRLYNGTAGLSYYCTMEATNGCGVPHAYTWSATGLPAGLSIAASTGLITGTPAAAGTSTVTVTVQDNAGQRASQSLSLTFAVSPSQGDGNGDGTVDVADALLALRVSVGIVTAAPAQLLQLDVAPLVNGKPAPDGKVDIGDAVVLLRKVVGVVSF